MLADHAAHRWADPAKTAPASGSFSETAKLGQIAADRISQRDLKDADEASKKDARERAGRDAQPLYRRLSFR